MGNTFCPSTSVAILGNKHLPPLPAMRSACSNRHQRPTQMRTHPVQHCSTRAPDQVRMCFARMVRSSTGSRPRPRKWVLRGGLCGSTHAESASNCIIIIKVCLFHMYMITDFQQKQPLAVYSKPQQRCRSAVLIKANWPSQSHYGLPKGSTIEKLQRHPFQYIS